MERNAKANLHSLFDEIERKQRRGGGNITWQNRAWMEWKGRERESGRSGGVEWSWRMWELSRIKRQPLISDIPKGEIGSAQKRRKRRRGNAACSEREID